MPEYTPPTDKVREVYEWYMDEYEHGRSSDYKAEFDRWLAAHDREVAAARAWDEGYGDDLEATTPRTNPYRRSDTPRKR